jgi:hypothetical protein
MTDDPNWDAPLTQAQWDACKWMFEPAQLAALPDELDADAIKAVA